MSKLIVTKFSCRLTIIVWAMDHTNWTCTEQTIWSITWISFKRNLYFNMFKRYVKENVNLFKYGFVKKLWKIKLTLNCLRLKWNMKVTLFSLKIVVSFFFKKKSQNISLDTSDVCKQLHLFFELNKTGKKI